MRRAPYFGWGIAVCLLTACLGAPGLVRAALADTIILKNGSHIVAAGVTRENGMVSFETSTGRLSLPESIVERIQKDSTGLAAPSNPRATDLKIAPPHEEPAGGEEAALIVRDGALDRDALASLDAAASGGRADAVARAVGAESAAGRFEFESGNLEEALAHAQRAASLAPSQVSLLLEVAYFNIMRSENTAALDTLERARSLAPDSPDVAKLAGWAEYNLNHLPEAVADWKRAQQLRPEAGVGQALEKAERDLEIEANFREGRSAHFDLRYYGGAAPGLAHDILQMLEEDFQSTATLLDYSPPEPIAVVLYTNEAFIDVTRAPKWVNGLNDGRIRLPVQGLDSVTPELAHVLKHELAHSFISLKTRDRSPVWVQEGIAQWVEGVRVGSQAALLLAMYDRHEDPSLSVLEESFLGASSDTAEVDYAWSLAVVEAVIASGGPGDINRFLDAITTEHSTEAAAEKALRMNYADLNRFTAEYLRRAYPQ